MMTWRNSILGFCNRINESDDLSAWWIIVYTGLYHGNILSACMQTSEIIYIHDHPSHYRNPWADLQTAPDHEAGQVSLCDNLSDRAGAAGPGSSASSSSGSAPPPPLKNFRLVVWTCFGYVEGSPTKSLYNGNKIMVIRYVLLKLWPKRLGGGPQGT